jgi:N-methylhydantoinase A/oxoprolinase/acetone carboxylase beta subunit
MGLLVNIDNGGTFTDVCVHSDTQVVHAKSPTTPHDLTQCFVSALTRVSRDLYGAEDLSRLVRDIDYIRYSTTSGTNAVVERKGTPVALLVEKGEEGQVYGLAKTLQGDSLWNSMMPIPPAGITVHGGNRIDAAELTTVVNDLLAKGAQRLVVALRSAEAEAQVKDGLLDRYPRHLLGSVPFLLSHELVSDSDDARRVFSALLNSYLHPGMEHFLYGAENVCKQNHLASPLLIYRNDGSSARVAKTTAIKTWGSGPRGGLEGALAYARLYGVPTLLAMDIGGTTTDVAVVADGKVRLNAYGRVEAGTTSFAMPELQSFGLGGSSIMRVEGGRLKIGPESVGSVPGPACFGRGGTHATLTDALLLAGVLDGENYLGGELRLDRDRAAAAIQKSIAEPLKLSLADATERAIRAFEAEVAAVLVQALAAAGQSASGATLLAFGGGGPMIASGIARDAGMRRIIVPQMAAVFSAYGIGFSSLAHQYLKSLAGLSAADIAAACKGMLQRARHDMSGEGVDAAKCRYDYALWTDSAAGVTQAPLDDGALTALKASDDARLVLTASYELPAFQLSSDRATRSAKAPTAGSTQVLYGTSAGDATPVVDVAALKPGHYADGPALLRSSYLTCLVDRGWSIRVSDNHDLIIEET